MAHNRSRLSLFGTVRAAFFGPFTKTAVTVTTTSRPFEDERAAIEGQIATADSTYTPAPPLRIAYVPFFWETVPHPHPTERHVVIKLRPQTAEKMAIGANGLHRYRGTIRCEIATKENSGTESARQIADDIAEHISNVTLSLGNSGKIRTGVPWYESKGVLNGWHRATLSVDYRRDKVFS